MVFMHKKRLIIDYLERNAEKWPNDTALIELDYMSASSKSLQRELTWESFHETSNRIASFLIGKNIKKGNHVALIMKNCLEWMPLFFGILKTGAVAVMLNYRLNADMLVSFAAHADVCAILYGSEMSEKMTQVKSRLFPCRQDFFIKDIYSELDRYSGRKPDIRIDENDSAAIYFSSGTTGSPKAVLLSHQSLVFSAQVEQKHHYQQKADCFLCMPPFYHAGATVHWFGSLITGGKAVLLNGTKPDMILDAINRECCTVVWLLVPWALDMLDALDRGKIRLSDYPNLKSWRLMHIGAQPVPISIIKRWETYFPYQQYEISYGLSESGGPGCVHTGVGNRCKPGMIGIPGWGWECKVVDRHYRDVPCGTVGELAVRGIGVMTGYYNNAEATGEVLSKDGWLYTGDMVVQDWEGYFYIVDRKKDVIISGGENIYPVPIENFIHAYEAVKDVAVIGFPDNRLGEVPGAIIQLKAGYSCTEEELMNYVQQLPRFQRPVHIIFGEVLRNSTGKIRKKTLRCLYSGTKNKDDSAR